METAKSTTTETRSRLIARVLRDVLALESFDRLPDLLDALKVRLARLRIPWTNDEFNDAMAWITTNRPLLVERRDDRPVERVDPSLDLPREDAARWLAEIRRRTGFATTPVVRSMPTVQRISQADADRAKALRMVLDDIAATAARCDALEREDAE